MPHALISYNYSFNIYLLITYYVIFITMVGPGNTIMKKSQTKGVLASFYLHSDGVVINKLTEACNQCSKGSLRVRASNNRNLKSVLEKPLGGGDISLDVKLDER